jgi:transcriptional regulator with GAF, ATPase, and Fis domain
VNCAALTETLLTSELFGHEKGSFTGATEQHQGRFELADGGTLFLDEISEISPDLQAKLLRVLEEREFERVGSTKSIHVDVRIIATTNRDLMSTVKQGKFREDLYYRLNVIPIILPPLRERDDDLPTIIKHYLTTFSKELGVKAKLADDGLALLVSYRWPGNVRELVNIVERLVVLNGSDTLDAIAVRRCLPELATMPAAQAQAGTALDFGALTLDEVERQHVLKTLDRLAGNVLAAGLGLLLGD